MHQHQDFGKTHLHLKRLVLVVSNNRSLSWRLEEKHLAEIASVLNVQNLRKILSFLLFLRALECSGVVCFFIRSA
jgi:hypothetical protein